MELIWTPRRPPKVSWKTGHFLILGTAPLPRVIAKDILKP